MPPPSEPPPAGLPSVQDGEPTVPVSQANDEAQPADQPAPEVAASGPWGVPPVKLTIPALGVEAAVEAVGEDPDGTMSTPTHPDDVAWYQLGAGMGVPGNVVLRRSRELGRPAAPVRPPPQAGGGRCRSR